ncbi:MAG: hypothetical protein HYU64_07110 [Armatimonadetes bacterium]|nr:hypothetical protein [Armatimonadota bacterium]
MDDSLVEKRLRKFELRSLDQGFKQDLKQTLLDEIERSRPLLPGKRSGLTRDPGSRAPFNRLAMTNALLAVLLFGFLFWDKEMSHPSPDLTPKSTVLKSTYHKLVSLLGRERTVPPCDVRKKYEEAGL